MRRALEGVTYFIYSTHSHTEEAPRCRLIILFEREVSEDEYPALTRMIAKQIGMEHFDDSTYQANRAMYWSSCPSNGVFIFDEGVGAPLDPDKYLAMYHDWRDVTQWPTSNRESEVMLRSAAQQKDPLAKDDLVGTFCRAYDPIETAIDEYPGGCLRTVGL